ncbi:uncharacterized protein TNCV_3621101 [Trichonephila clavipes]|nr:uncharacterized protein TNCV_3621101 [Trichonephila clavipes]
MKRLPETIFRQDNTPASYGKSVTQLSTYCYYPSLALPNTRFVSNRAYLKSFGTVDLGYREFERTKGKVTANMEWNEISQNIIQNLYARMPDHTTLRICTRGVQHGIKTSVLLPCSLK